MEALRTMIPKAATILLLTVGVLAMPASSPARSPGSRAEFCRPQRSLASFGGQLGRRVTGYGAHLVAAPEAVPAGGTPALRLLNVGTEEVSYGPRRTQRWVEGSWRAIPDVGYVQPELDYLPAGTVSRCIGPTTGRYWPAGRYRWVVEARPLAKGAGAAPRVLRAVFKLRARR